MRGEEPNAASLTFAVAHETHASTWGCFLLSSSGIDDASELLRWGIEADIIVFGWLRFMLDVLDQPP